MRPLIIKVYYAANMKHPYAHAFQEIFGKKPPVLRAQQDVRRKPSNTWDEYIRTSVEIFAGDGFI